MSLIVLYLGTRYDVCECNSLRYMTISSFLCDLWTSPVTFIVRQGHFHFYHEMDVILLCIGFKYEVCRFKKSLRYGQLFGENLNDVIMTSSPIRILWKLNTNRPRIYLSDIPKFIFIKHKRAEIYSREVNKDLWRKNGYYVTVTLTFDPRSPNSIGSEPLREATI